tara:strand:- start:5719 stop:6429 length:711 start_codon:yes stop_codon:yes gene_type:complete
MSILAAGLGLTLLLTPSLVVQSASHGAQQPRAADVHRRHGAPTSIAIPTEPLMRIGHGYDIHRMAPREEAGQPLVVGGATFDGSTAPDFELGCVAHSDGDVIYHSVVDAILGALTMPDIGQLFPDNDPRLKGSNSEIFMEEAYSRMVDRGYAIGNVDVTLIAQKPRINVEHAGRAVKSVMHENLARLLRTDASRVNVKARTHEKVDSVGEARAIECHVVLTLEKQPGPVPETPVEV